VVKGLSSSDSDAESIGLSSKSFVKKGRLLDLDVRHYWLIYLQALLATGLWLGAAQFRTAGTRN